MKLPDQYMTVDQECEPGKLDFIDYFNILPSTKNIIQ